MAAITHGGLWPMIHQISGGREQIDLPSLLGGIVLIAAATALLLFARRSVNRVESADAADQRERGGLQVWQPMQRWFGIGLLGVPVVLLFLVGALLLLGSLGGGLPGPMSGP